MSARVSGLGFKNHEAEDAFNRFIATADATSLGPQVLCLARAYAIETLHDRAAIERINAALRALVCARLLGLQATA